MPPRTSRSARDAVDESDFEAQQAADERALVGYLQAQATKKPVPKVIRAALRAVKPIEAQAYQIALAAEAAPGVLPPQDLVDAMGTLVGEGRPKILEALHAAFHAEQTIQSSGERLIWAESLMALMQFRAGVMSVIESTDITWSGLNELARQLSQRD